jgi:2-polyprenyl-6-methoxyphenol hydroxylase-like FAD-dependent oxidoreductase
VIRSFQRIIVIGAGPVGLCLSLALAQEGVPVTLIEALGDDFLEQAAGWHQSSGHLGDVRPHRPLPEA